EHCIVPVGMKPLRQLVFGHEAIAGTVIDTGLVEVSRILPGSGHIHQVGSFGYAHEPVVGHHQFAGAAFFGGDEQHSVGGAHAVNSCSRSIFQDIHRHDISRINITDIVGDHAVHHIKRVSAAEHGAGAAHPDGRQGVRLAGADDLNACHLALDSLGGGEHGL